MGNNFQLFAILGLLHSGDRLQAAWIFSAASNISNSFNKANIYSRRAKSSRE